MPPAAKTLGAFFSSPECVSNSGCVPSTRSVTWVRCACAREQGCGGVGEKGHGSCVFGASTLTWLFPTTRQVRAPSPQGVLCLQSPTWQHFSSWPFDPAAQLRDPASQPVSTSRFPCPAVKFPEPLPLCTSDLPPSPSSYSHFPPLQTG